MSIIKYILLLSFRNLRRYRSTSSIKIIGLSTGLVCTLLIFLWIQDEMSYDKFHEKDSHLYQVMLNYKNPHGIYTFEWTPGPLVNALQDEIPEIQIATQLYTAEEGIIDLGEEKIRAQNVYAGSDFFKVFSFELIEGNKDNVLTPDNSIVISSDLAKKLFSTDNGIIGKAIQWEQGKLSDLYTITGVFKQVPRNSTLQFDAVFSYGRLASRIPDMMSWERNEPSTFVVLTQNANVDKVNASISSLIGNKPNLENASAFLRQFSDRYLYNEYENGVLTGGRITYVKYFLIIAALILGIACINFMNLSTAQASRRIKEIGIKKTMGVSRSDQILHFLLESIFLSFLAALAAIFIILIILPDFNLTIGKQLDLTFNLQTILSILGITLITGLISGSYPAFYLSRFTPSDLLSGVLNIKTNDLWLRRGLIGLQFTIAIVLIISTIVIYRQMDFIQTKNLGYNRDNIIQFKREGKLKDGLETFLQEARNLPGVLSASSSSHKITDNSTSTIGLDWEGKDPETPIAFGYIAANYDFIELMGIELSQGRSFSQAFSTEHEKIVLNESAAKTIGVENPIGQVIRVSGRDNQVIGVAKDFHFRSLYDDVGPFFFRLSERGEHILIKLRAGQEKETIQRLTRFYKEFNNGLPLIFEFLDQEYQAIYDAEQRVVVLSKYFAGIAILLSCLGLFGLSTFNTQRRIKEIGIRRVLGSGVLDIIYLLSKEFTIILAMAILIALPTSYLGTKEWLDNFAYHIDLEWWIFVGTGILVLCIAWITVGIQVFKTARMSPINYLKNE